MIDPQAKSKEWFKFGEGCLDFHVYKLSVNSLGFVKRVGAVV